jgi:hypothetical protein
MTAAVALGLFGCGAMARDREKGRLEANWTGAVKGRMNGHATAIWCGAGKIAQLTAIQGDTGLGLLIHATDSLVAGPYPIVDAASAQTRAPGAALGLRLITQAAVVGYQGRGGTLTLEQVGGARISGRFEARAIPAAMSAGSISVNGRFLHVAVAPGGPACPP